MNALVQGSVLKQHLIDPEICIRCNTCEAICPVGAITHDSRNYVVKADICNGCMDCISPCSSVPLSETIIPSSARRLINVVNSRATRRPEIDMLGVAAGHSRVTSSTTFSTRNHSNLLQKVASKHNWHGGFLAGTMLNIKN